MEKTTREFSREEHAGSWQFFHFSPTLGLEMSAGSDIHAAKSNGQKGYHNKNVHISQNRYCYQCLSAISFEFKVNLCAEVKVKEIRVLLVVLSHSLWSECDKLFPNSRTSHRSEEEHSKQLE